MPVLFFITGIDTGIDPGYIGIYTVFIRYLYLQTIDFSVSYRLHLWYSILLLIEIVKNKALLY